VEGRLRKINNNILMPYSNEPLGNALVGIRLGEKRNMSGSGDLTLPFIFARPLTFFPFEYEKLGPIFLLNIEEHI